MIRSLETTKQAWPLFSWQSLLSVIKMLQRCFIDILISYTLQKIILSAYNTCLTRQYLREALVEATRFAMRSDIDHD